MIWLNSKVLFMGDLVGIGIFLVWGGGVEGHGEDGAG